MQTIEQVSVQNFLGISAITLAPTKPIVLIAGNNGAGKTSLYQAIRLALFDELPRVDLKRDAGSLVRGGASKGEVSVTLTDHEAPATVYGLALPTRTRTPDVDTINGNGVMGLCFDPMRLVRMAPADRARLILNLSGVKMTPDVVAERMRARNIPEDVIAEIRPLLVLGFEKCVAHAKEQTAEARGAWKSITGETYGAVKANTWAPAAAGLIPDAPMGLPEAVERHSAAAARLANLEAHRALHVANNEQTARDKSLAPKVAALRATVAELAPTADALEERATLSCPECGAMLDMVDGKLSYTAKDVAPQARVKPAVKAKAAAALATAKRELAQAEAAAARLETPPALPAYPTAEDLTAATEVVAQATDLLRSITTQQEAYSAAVQAAASVGERADKAKAAHTCVVAWDAVATALSPEGIPSELMTQAMQPMRSALKAACASEYVSDWPLPDISNEGGLQAWGRPVQMLSESEEYRVAAILAAAFARLSGSGMIALDRADVLSPTVRAELMAWLSDMVDGEVIGQAWVFATLKAAPNVGDDIGIEVHWIDNGATA